MRGNDLAFARLFACGSEAGWTAAVEGVLKGRSAASLTGHTDDGIPIAPLYTSAKPAPVRRALAADPGYPWDIRCRIACPDPRAANSAILDDLNGGASSVTLVLDRALRFGITDAEASEGIALHALEDMETVLAGVRLDLAAIGLDAGVATAPAAFALFALGEKRGVDKEKLAVALNADPLAVLAGTGFLPQTLETAFETLTFLARECAAHYPRSTAVGVSTLPYHNGGCSEAQELAAALATALAYLRAMETGGLSIGQGARQILFRVTADADFLLTVAKLRALRVLWDRILDACGATGEAPARIEAISAPRMLSRRAPFVNILRATAAGLGAVAGGADVIALHGHDAAFGAESSLARRIARNLQVLLQEESNLGRVSDPAAGSYAIENLTHALMEKAWSLFREIEGAGGMVSALRAGLAQRWIAAARAERENRIATLARPLTGVSSFPDIHEKAIAPEQIDLEPVRRAARAKTWRGGDASRCGETPLMAAAKVVSQGAGFSQALAPLAGRPEIAEAIPLERLAEDFEALRDRSDKFLETNGARPRIALINLGRASDFMARSTFARNLFEAGGIEAAGNEGVMKGEDADLLLGDAPFAVICSSDAIYQTEAEAAARELKEAGARKVYLAGKGGALATALRAAGVDDFIHAGCDIRAVLDAALMDLGA